MTSVKRNLGWNILLTVSGYLFPMLTFPYITRVLGVENFGLANFAMSVVDYAIIFANLGLGAIGCRYIAQCTDNVTKRNRVFNNLLSIHITWSLCILAIYTCCVFYVPQFNLHRNLYFVGVLKIISNVFLVSWLFEGMQDFRYITIRNVAVRTIYVISVFLFVKQKDDYDIYFYLTVGQVVLNALVNWKYANKYVRFSFSLNGSKEYIFPVFSMSINTLLFSFYGTFNVIYLGLKCGDASVGYFTTATKLYAIILSIISAYNGVFVPFLNSLYGKGEMDKFSQYIGHSFSIVSLLAVPLVVGCVVLAPEFVQFIAGIGFERAIVPFQIVMIQVLLVGIAQILENQILLSLKKFREVLICTSISTFIAVLILLLFVPLYAEIASAYAVAIPHIIEALLLYYYAKKCFIFRFPFKGILVNCLACMPIIVICYFIRVNSVNCAITVLVSGVISAIYYFAIQYYLIKNSFIINQVANFSDTTRRKIREILR